MKAMARNGGIAGIVAGAAYMLQAVMGLVKPQAEVFSGLPDYILEAVFVVALAATVLALFGVHAFAQGRYGWPGTTGFVLAAAGTSLMTVGAAASLLAGRSSLGAAFLGGLLLAALGYVLLGIAALQARVFPAWLSLALALGLPVSVFLAGFAGGLLLGLAWLATGIFLLRE